MESSQKDELKKRLAALDAERSAIAIRLVELEADSTTGQPTPGTTLVRRSSPAAAKIALFRDLFRGREDVFARRWDNPKTGRAGYAPACRNEWVRGVCGKPMVKCGGRPHQAFIPLSSDAIRRHLQGRNSERQDELVIGLYLDAEEPVLAKTAAQREAGYAALGFEVTRGRVGNSGHHGRGEHSPG